jgi:hypothetical protein
MTILDEVLAQWQTRKPDSVPPSEAVVLWQNARCTLYVDDDLGPCVPYSPVDHGDGTMNHGYLPLKGNKDAIRRVPELQGWPAFAGFIEAINEPTSPIESIGCEIGYFDVTDCGAAITMVGSYTDVVFSETGLNEMPENFLHLAARLMRAVVGCEQWRGSVEFGLQRLRGLQGTEEPWGLMIRICNHGRNKEEAHKFWCETVSKLSAEILRLPQGFP